MVTPSHLLGQKLVTKSTNVDSGCAWEAQGDDLRRHPVHNAGGELVLGNGVLKAQMRD